MPSLTSFVIVDDKCGIVLLELLEIAGIKGRVEMKKEDTRKSMVFFIRNKYKIR